MNRGLSIKKTLSSKQFRALGYPRPFKGWERLMIGRYYTEARIEEFMSLQNEHLINSKRVFSQDELGQIKAAKKKNEKKYRKVILPPDIENYKHPHWLLKRKEIYRERGSRCESCGQENVTLHVHHLLYEIGKEPWDVPNWYLVILCEDCHKGEHSKNLYAPKKHF